MSPTTSGRNVERTRSRMRATASSPAAMLTPAASYDSPTDCSRGNLDATRREVGAVHCNVVLNCIATLGGRHGRDVDGVLAGEARRAEPGTGGPGGRHQAVELEVGEGVGTEVLADLAHRHAGSEQLGAGAEVHPEEAGPGDRRQRDAQMDLGGAGLSQHADEGPLRGAPDDGVVDDDNALAGDVLADGVELHAHTDVALVLARS